MSIALISHPDCLLHNMGSSHPECPDRVRVIEDAVHQSHLDFKTYLAPLATREQLLRVHSKQYVDHIFQIAPKQGFVPLDPDTGMSPNTLTAALRAAGAVILGVDLVMKNTVNTVFCNVRPPGHHAEKSQAMGFCFFNNIAVGVAYALAHYHLQRIAIIDFDVHHGNGTEDIFRNNNQVLYCSSFQNPFYPFSGAETQSSHILNLPLPAKTTGKAFREQVELHWFETISRFQPEILFISAGFDAHEQDEMSDLRLTEEDYSWISQKIKKMADTFCEGRIVSVLEGGYALGVLGKCVVAHLAALENTSN